MPFVLIGLGLFAANFLVTQKKKSSEWNKTMGTKTGTGTQKEAQEEDDSVASFQVEPISVEIGYGLILSWIVRSTTA